MVDKDYSYNRFGTKGSRVGQAVHDILSQEQPEYTAEEMLDEMGKGIMNYIQEAAETGYKEFKGDFYIVHFFKKTLTQHDIQNAMSQKAVCFQKGPLEPAWYMQEKPNDAKTLYEVDAKNGVIKLVWTVPGWEDCKTIKKSPDLYDRDLVSWVKDATQSFEKSKASL